MALIRCRRRDLHCRFGSILLWFASLVVLTSSQATIVIEPDRPDANANSSSSTPLRVVNDCEPEQLLEGGYDCGDTFSLNLKSNNRIQFVLRPPSGVKEIILSTTTPGEPIELILRAALIIDGGVMTNNCTDSSTDGRGQLLVGALMETSVSGSDADTLAAAYKWEQSYISIDKFGCAIESRLFFQPPTDDATISSNIERLTWSADYDPAFIGGDGSVASSYKLESSYGTESNRVGAVIQGGSLELVEEEEEETLLLLGETQSPTPGPSSSSATSASCNHIFACGVVLCIGCISSAIYFILVVATDYT